MSFNPQRLKKAFYAFSGVFKRQSAFGTAIPDVDLDTRHNCTVEFEDVVQTEVVYDCGGEDIFDENVESQLKRVTLNYASITPQIIFGWIAMLLGACAAPTGTPNDEVQTATDANIDGGAAALTFAFEGRTGTTAAIAYNAAASVFQSALEALDSIGEGNVSVTGTLATGLAVTFQNDLEKANVPLITFGAGFTDGGSPVTPVFVQTTAGGNKYHAATRSTDDQLPKTSMGCGYDTVTAATPHKYRDLVVESVQGTINRRRNVTGVVTLLGRFTPADMAAFSVPECENLPALKGRDCEVLIDGNYLSDEFWQATFNLSNQVPTGDDAFDFDDVEVSNLERGDKPTYPITLQILGSEGDTVGELCRTRTKVPIEFRLGKPGDRCNLIFPNVLMKFASNPRVFVGERNRSAHNIDAVPHKDDTLHAPMRAEAYLDQTATFLASA
jgi:hypothetical protein